MLRNLIFIICFISIHSTTWAQSADQIVDNYFQAIGGLEKWNNIKTRIISGHLIKMPVKSIFEIGSTDTLNTLLKIKKPNKFFYESSGKALFSNILCFDGEILWTQSSSGLKSVKTNDEIEYFQNLNMNGLADILAEKSTEIESLGIEKLKNVDYYVLKITVHGWMFSQKYFFDLKTGLPFCSMALGSINQRYTIYKDYRENAGMMIHYVEEVYDHLWNLESRAIFSDIRINSELDDDEFIMPKK